MEKLEIHIPKGHVKMLEAYYEYRSTKEGNRMDELLTHLNQMAIEFCESHDITCCTRKDYKHSHYQCKHNSDPIIASYQECKFSCHDIEQVEKYIAYDGAHELDSLINEKFETSHEARVMKGHISIILHMCKNEFSNNPYVIKYKERTLAAMEITNILQEKEDENIILEKENKEEIIQPKLGDMWEPFKHDSNSQTQTSFVINKSPCTSCEETETPMVVCEMTMHSQKESNDTPQNMLANSSMEIINDNKDYDNALDDGPMPNDRNDIIVIHDDALIRKSPILFLNSPNHTIEEKLAYVKKYLCGLQLSLVPNLCCSHNIKIDTNPSNYFERGKKTNEFHNKFNDPLCMKNSMNLHALNDYNVRYAASKCN